MMEFTANGLVRFGFGFANPNHAAAALTALIPLCWGWKRRPALGWTLSAALAVPLAMTFSRTGMLVLVFEIAAFALLTRGRCGKWLIGVLGVALVSAGIAGVFGRFALDGAILNRPAIWSAGMRLLAANPHGVGLGNSGAVASAFLLPESIRCRTLVNSHLTLAVEFGVAAAFLWMAALSYGLVRGIRRPGWWCALAGLTLSAASASIFDWGVLFDFSGFGGGTQLNYGLSWALLALYLAVLTVCVRGKPYWDRIAACAVAALFAVAVFPLAFLNPETPRVRDNCVIRGGTPRTLVCRDAAWPLRSVRPFLRGGYVLPLEPGTPVRTFGASRALYFGAACDGAGKFPGPVRFVRPPETAELPANLCGVALPPWADANSLLRERLAARGVPVETFPATE